MADRGPGQNGLSALDDAVEAAVAADDQEQLAQALQQLHDKVRAVGTEVADDELADSDLILPEPTPPSTRCERC